MTDTPSTEAPVSVVVAGDGTVEAPAPAATPAAPTEPTPTTEPAIPAEPPAAPKARAKRASTPTEPATEGLPVINTGGISMDIRTF